MAPLPKVRMKLMTWNVNGIRAVHSKGFHDFIKAEKPDVLGLQEIKAQPEQMPKELREIEGYQAYFCPAVKPGYSGTALYSRIKPDEVWMGVGVKELDLEGRLIALRFGELNILSTYWPNSQEGGKRREYKEAWIAALMKKAKALQKKGQHLVIGGDYNVAHMPIDLEHPKENEESPGYFPWEREALTRFFAAGFTDVFRAQNPGKAKQYTWWSYCSAARERNVGWRIDYHCATPGLEGRLGKAFHRDQVKGSDHCPIGLELKD